MNNLIISNKNLLIEINRINELISPQHNPKKIILLEQLSSVVDEILSKYSSRVSTLFGFTAKENYEMIIKSLKTIYGKKGGDIVIRDLDPKTPVRELIDIFPKLLDSTKRTFVELIIKYSNENIDNALEDTVTGMLNITKDDFKLLAERFGEEDFISKLDPNNTTPEFLRTYLSRFWKKTRNISNILSTDDIVKFSDWVNKKGGKTFFSDIVKAWSISIDEILDNVKNLNDEFVGKLESGIYGDEQITNITNAYSLAISRQMNMWNMRIKDGADAVLKRSDLDNSLKNKILNGQEDIFVLFRKLREGKLTNVTTANKKFQEVWNSFSIGLSKKTEEIKFRYPQIKISPELKQYFLTGQWAFLSDFYKIAVKNNSLKSNTSKTAYLLRLGLKSVWGNLLAAGALSFLWTIWTETIIKEGINKIFETFGFNPLFPNPDEGRSESEGVLGTILDTWWKTFMSFVNTGTILIPVVGTVEISPLGYIGKFLFNKTKFGVQEVKKEVDQDLEGQSGNVPLPDTGELPPIDGGNQGVPNQDTPNQDTNQGGF